MYLSKMSITDYQDYLTYATHAYAQDKIQAGTWSPAEAQTLAAESFQRLLPDGPNTPDHYVFSLMQEGIDQPIGILWIHAQDQKAFIYDFEINSAYRGQGYGKAALKVAEQWAHTQGIREIGLHVFAHNQSAYHLYKKMGYLETDISMVRQIDAEPQPTQHATATTFSEKLDSLIALRESGRASQDTAVLKEALTGFQDLIHAHPQEPVLHYQIGICFDNLGFTNDAIPHYERAISLGLGEDDLRRCYLGLGSSYRVTGQYAHSLAILEKAVEQFPEYKPLHLFYALTLFNTQHYEQALEKAFLTLLPDNQDPDIRYFEKGLHFYATHLDDTWSPAFYQEQD